MICLQSSQFLGDVVELVCKVSHLFLQNRIFGFECLLFEANLLVPVRGAPLEHLFDEVEELVLVLHPEVFVVPHAVIDPVILFSLK